MGVKLEIHGRGMAVSRPWISDKVKRSLLITPIVVTGGKEFRIPLHSGGRKSSQGYFSSVKVATWAAVRPTDEKPPSW